MRSTGLGSVLFYRRCMQISNNIIPYKCDGFLQTKIAGEAEKNDVTGGLTFGDARASITQIKAFLQTTIISNRNKET